MNTGNSPLPFGDMIQAAAAETGIQLSAEQQLQLATHLQLLLQWNEKMSLTSLRDPQQIAARHFAESLFLSTLLADPCGKVVDVGSGAGFPGLPLSAVWPRSEMILLEPNSKKCTFLKEVIRHGAFHTVRVLNERLEDAAGHSLERQADLAMMRAVQTSDKVVLNLARLLKPSGRVALFLGEADAGRVTAHTQLIAKTVHRIPGSDHRVILILQKDYCPES